jgi:hypothetical protein
MFCDVYLPAAGAPRLTKQALADRLHLTRDQVRYALEAVNRQFVDLLRAEVAGQAATEEDIDTEIRELEALLGR